MKSFLVTVLGGLLKLVIIAGVLYFFLILYFTQHRPQSLNEFQEFVTKSFSSDERLKQLNSQMQDSLQKIESEDEFIKNAIPAVTTSTTNEEMQKLLVRLQSNVLDLQERVEQLEKQNRELESLIRK